MSLILAIETGTDICSVGIAKDGELLSLRESDEGRDHARKVGVFVDIAQHLELVCDNLGGFMCRPSSRNSSPGIKRHGNENERV